MNSNDKPLFESLEDCQAAISLLMRKDALDALRNCEPVQGKRLIEAFDRLAAAGNNKRRAPIVVSLHEDRHVDIHEASRMIGFSKTWLYRRARQLPFTRVSSTGRLRFSAKGIQEYLARMSRPVDA